MAPDSGGDRLMGDGEEGEDSTLDDSQDFSDQVKDLWQEAHPNKRKRLHDGDRQTENNTKPQSGGEDPSSTQVPVNVSSSNAHAGGVPDRLLKNRYPSNCSGPFTILIRPANISVNTKRLNATHTGKVLMTKFKLEQLAHIYSSGKFQNTAIFSSASAANELSLGILSASNLTAYIPDSFLSCEGLIRGVPTDFPVEELLTNIKSPHEILDIRRQNRKIKKNNQFELIPTQSVYLRFEGRNRPDQVSLFQVRYTVDPWYAPIKICYQCFVFGHVSLQCKSQPKCINCGNKNIPKGRFVYERTALLAIVIVRANINPPTKCVQVSSMKRPWPRKEIFHWLKTEPSFRIRRPRLHQKSFPYPLRSEFSSAILFFSTNPLANTRSNTI